MPQILPLKYWHQYGETCATRVDDPAVVDMLESHISRPDAGGESDAVFAWLYAWSRSPSAPLQRFVARFAPSLAAQYLLRSASNVSSPGLEVLQVGSVQRNQCLHTSLTGNVVERSVELIRRWSCRLVYGQLLNGIYQSA